MDQNNTLYAFFYALRALPNISRYSNANCNCLSLHFRLIPRSSDNRPVSNNAGLVLHRAMNA
eukprot:3421196-Amphidinium_carterae.1